MYKILSLPYFESIRKYLNKFQVIGYMFNINSYSKCLQTQLLTIFQLFYGGQFYWQRKLDYTCRKLWRWPKSL